MYFFDTLSTIMTREDGGIRYRGGGAREIPIVINDYIFQLFITILISL